ncbi:MAG: hypothetical protein QM765_46005 [Myxococcales bacterium]
MKLLNPILLGLALVLGGCAMQSKPPPSKAVADQPGPSAAEDEAAMKEAVEQLDKAKADAVVPRAHNDCQAVCKLADLICEAADKICTIAGRHTGEEAYTAKCTGADKDCKSAQSNCETCTDRQ